MILDALKDPFWGVRKEAVTLTKKLKEEKIELERSFEVGLRVQLTTTLTILTILTIIIKVGLRGQARRIERLLRSLEVAENQADWLAREVRSKEI